jgi:SAM-dependent methyltransferase
VDQGSELLLNTLVRCVDLDGSASLLDVGCGTGVLGICLKKVFPHLKLLGIDRDALAVLFSMVNARMNGMEDAKFIGRLGAGPASMGEWSGIVCNLPAKAGEPVLKSFIHSMAYAVDLSGFVGIVIVSTLEKLAARAISECGSRIIARVNGSRHTVYIYGKGMTMESFKSNDLDLSSYIRTQTGFASHGISCGLETVFGLADFNTVGYGTNLVVDLLDRVRPAGNAVFWNPGQGHAPVFFYHRSGGQVKPLLLAGRDLLSLEISRANLRGAGQNEKSIKIIHTPFPCGTAYKGDLVVYCPNPEPESALYDTLLSRLSPWVNPGGILVIVSGSAAMFRILQRKRDFISVRDIKRRGFRGVILKKKTDRS